MRNGATGPLAGIVHSLTLVAVLLVAVPLAGRIPLAALAAILFVVAWNMSDARGFVRMARTAPSADTAILLITFALTVLTDLVIAVNIGVILAMLQFLRRMASSVEVRAAGVGDLAELGGPAPAGVLVFSIEGPFFFGAVDSLERALARAHADARAVVLRLGHVPFIDVTGLESLGEAVRGLERRGVPLVMCEANGRVLRKLLRAGLVRQGPKRRYYSTLALAVAHCGRA